MQYVREISTISDDRCNHIIEKKIQRGEMPCYICNSLFHAFSHDFLLLANDHDFFLAFLDAHASGAAFSVMLLHASNELSDDYVSVFAAKEVYSPFPCFVTFFTRPFLPFFDTTTVETDAHDFSIFPIIAISR